MSMKDGHNTKYKKVINKKGDFMSEKSIVEIKAEILDLLIEKDMLLNKIKAIENVINEKFVLLNNMNSPQEVVKSKE